MLDVGQLANFFTSVLALSAALLVIALIAWLLRRLGYSGPLEPSEFVEGMFGHGQPKGNEASVNVGLIDAKAQAMIFGSFIEVTMHNGHGKKYQLQGGTFEACNPKSIKVGATVEVSYQSAAFTEKLKVRLNHKEQHLYIQSKHSIVEILNRIEGDESLRLAPIGQGQIGP